MDYVNAFLCGGLLCAIGQIIIDKTQLTKLSFSYLGFRSVDWTVPTGSDKVTYNLAMQSESESIDDVVVIAYGVRKKGTIAGSVSAVEMENVTDTPTAAFDQSIGKPCSVGCMWRTIK